MNTIEVSKLSTLTGHNDCVYTIEPTNKDNLFVSGAGDGMVVEWDLENPEDGHLVAKLPNSVYGLHHLHDQNLLAVGNLCPYIS